MILVTFVFLSSPWLWKAHHKRNRIMSLEALIVVVLVVGFIGFIAYKVKKSKNNKSIDNSTGGSNIKQEFKSTHKK